VANFDNGSRRITRAWPVGRLKSFAVLSIPFPVGAVVFKVTNFDSILCFAGFTIFLCLLLCLIFVVSDLFVDID